MQMLFCENLNSTKLRKNLLGELVLYGGEVKWLLRPMSMVPEYVHLWIATQGTKGSKELRVKIASSAAIAIWDLA